MLLEGGFNRSEVLAKISWLDIRKCLISHPIMFACTKRHVKKRKRGYGWKEVKKKKISEKIEVEREENQETRPLTLMS